MPYTTSNTWRCKVSKHTGQYPKPRFFLKELTSPALLRADIRALMIRIGLGGAIKL